MFDGFESGDWESSWRSLSLGSLSVMIFFRLDFEGALPGAADGAGDAVAGVSGVSITELGLSMDVC